MRLLQLTRAASRPRVRILAELLLAGWLWFQRGLTTAVPNSLEGIPLLQLLLLSVIDDHGTHGAELARRVGVCRQAVYPQIRLMERRGWVTQVPGVRDRRTKLVVRTDLGTGLHLQVRYVLLGMEDILEDRIGLRALENLTELLKLDWGSPTPPYPELEQIG